jgi:hypothetical protein
LRAELDAVLEKLDVFAQAQLALVEADRRWFIETLQAELTQQGNLARFEAQLMGHGAVAQGQQTQAVVAGWGLIARGVGGDSLGPGATKIVNSPMEPSRDDHVEACERYLLRLRRFCQGLPLPVLGPEEGTNGGVTLDHLYIELDTTTEVTPNPFEQQEAEDAGCALAHMALAHMALAHMKNSCPVTALEAVTQNRRVVLLGTPERGKAHLYANYSGGWPALTSARKTPRLASPETCYPS